MKNGKFNLQMQLYCLQMNILLRLKITLKSSIYLFLIRTMEGSMFW